MNNLDMLPLFGGQDFEGVEKITVNTKPNAYDIMVSDGIINRVDQLWRAMNLSSQVLVVTDPVVFDLYGKTLLSNFNYQGIEPVVHLVPQGESSKSMNELSRIYDVLVEHKFSRDSVIVALGGGVIGDLSGYAAASYMRGINLVQVPTTLLAQVDSSIGGKTAINHEKGKNLIGAFYQPRAVLIDVGVLSTLPQRELITGMAEVVKYGVIDDRVFFEMLEVNADNLLIYTPEYTKIWVNIITTSCRIKAKVVTLDERENGLRAILNFGHTIAHAIESITAYTRYNHGEAVAIGMVGAAIIARNRGLIDTDVQNRITRLLTRLGLPVSFSANDAEVLDLLRLDKKAKSGRIRFVLPQRLGNVEIYSDISDQEILTALSELKEVK